MSFSASQPNTSPQEEDFDDEFYNQLLKDLSENTPARGSEWKPGVPGDSAPERRASEAAAIEDLQFDTFSQELVMGMEALVAKLEGKSPPSPPLPAFAPMPAVVSAPTESPAETATAFQARIQQTMAQRKASEAAAAATPSSADPEAQVAELFKTLAEQFERGDIDDTTSEALSNDLVNSLLTKDLLVEPLQMLKAQYEPYLAAHSATLSPEERAKFVRQSLIIEEILEIYASDRSEDVPKIMPLFTEMQELGAIPDEILTSLLTNANPNEPLNPAELDALHNMTSDCKTM